MKKLVTLRSAYSLALLLIAISALISGIKVSVRNVEDAAFFPVAAFAVILSYVLGFSTWSTRRVWSIVLITSFLVAFMESARLIEPIKAIIHSIPRFEFELIRWMLEKEVPKEIPDTSVFKTQISAIVNTTGVFIPHLLKASVKIQSVREFFWDIPLLLLAAWAGWGITRWNQPLFALAPLLGFHAFILNYTGKDTFSLQISVFAVIMLLGINQRWNISRENTANSERAARETYPAIILLSITLAIAAGIIPSISFKDVTQKLTKKDELAEAIGLEKAIAQVYTTSGLPRQHLIGLSPSLSNTVIFTVKTGEIAPNESSIIKETVPRHYWRWLTYDVYNGQGWSTSPAENNSYPANAVLLPVTNEMHRTLHLQVEKTLTQDSRLFWTGSLASATQPFDASWRISPESLSTSDDPYLSTDMLGAITTKQIYQADSLLPIVSANQLRASSQIYPAEILSRYLTLPESLPQRVRDLAQELTVNITNPYDKAKAIEAHLREYPYSLDITPPPPNRDIADYFLFDLKTGYCDYYATSMIVLARAVGLPARMVIGYANGNYDPVSAEYVVLEANAHSWVEIYFTGVGWVEFEPTASQLQISLPDELPQENISPEQGRIVYTKKGFFPERAHFSLLIGLLSIILISSSWFLHTQGLMKSHKTIGSIYEYIFSHGKKIYRDAPLHETPSIFANKLKTKLRTGSPWLIPAPDEIKILTELYIQETYSGHPITKDEHAIAAKVWRKLFWRLMYARILRL
jgi:transglutaminase-like putative cysteine protease